MEVLIVMAARGWLSRFLSELIRSDFVLVELSYRKAKTETVFYLCYECAVAPSGDFCWVIFYMEKEAGY